MANREELGLIRGARAGDADCQLALGKRYLFGGASLPVSLPTALHWLRRAAAQRDEAWQLIGRHIPYDHALPCMPDVLCWYERAYDAGGVQAGLVLAQLVLQDAASGPELRDKALLALDAAARAGLAEARWLLARQAGQPAAVAVAVAERGAGAAEQAAPDTPASRQHSGPSVPAAQYAVLAQAWDDDRGSFLQQAQPVVQAVLAAAPADAEAARAADWVPEPGQLSLLAHCAELMSSLPQQELGLHQDLHQCRELAAYGGDPHAQLALGLWFARMNGDGARQPRGIAAVNFKRAIRWLTLAGEQGLADAWYALSRIYLKPEFSQRCVAEAQHYLERAAEMGHCGAQLECGMYAWRNRRTDEHSDVRAAGWLQQAAGQGCVQAEAMLARIAAPSREARWADSIVASITREALESQPLLAARLELAELFGLSRAEALLLDVKGADHGHCLVVDIRASYGRSKRRLILLKTARERQALDRIVRLFEHIDNGPDGLEGNYRQRLYRLKTWLLNGQGEHLLAA